MHGRQSAQQSADLAALTWHLLLCRNYALENAMEAANLPLVELMDRSACAHPAVSEYFSVFSSRQQAQHMAAHGLTHDSIMSAAQSDKTCMRRVRMQTADDSERTLSAG